MLKRTNFLALLTFLIINAVGSRKLNSENLRKLFDETNADETNLANGNLKENEIKVKNNLKNDNDIGSYSRSSSQKSFDSKNQQSDIFEEELKAQETQVNSVESSLVQLDEMISKANPGLKASKRTKRSSEKTDIIDGDIKLDRHSAANLVAFYKRNPQYLRLDNNEADTPALNSLERRKRKVDEDGKWSFPIKYRILLSTEKELVRKALKIWQQETCVSFSETGAIRSPGIIFKENEKGCWSYVGRRSSDINEINLANGCKHLGIILHEIGYALGMWHEQSRPDRNKYVTIVEENIESGRNRNFMVRPGFTYGTQYDYGSIMHYSETTFAEKGQKTIIAKQRDYEKTMGQRTGLSFNDIKAINFHYCQGRCFGGLTWSSCRNGGYRDPRSCGRCKCPEGWTGTYCQYLKKSTTGCGWTDRSAKSYYKYLSTPGYFFPWFYTTNAECTWKITAPAGKRIRFEFTWTFSLSCDTPCLDFVEVRFNSLSNTGPRYCCNSRPGRIFTSTGEEMLVLLRTNADSGARGFRARFKYV